VQIVELLAVYQFLKAPQPCSISPDGLFDSADSVLRGRVCFSCRCIE
jgi:hypothetical protein